MNWYNLDSKEAVKEMGGFENGLGKNEVKKRMSKFGKNVLRKHKVKSLLQVFLSQFNSLLIWVLIISAVVSGVVGHIVDAVVIGIIVILNAGIGFFQEYKAESIIEKLKKSLKYRVMVLRDGKQVEIDAQFLVPGDIVILEAGNKVLADARILRCDELQTNEAALSGESFPIEKTSESLKGDVVLAERKNMVYAGTSVVKGRATVMVTETGIRTEFGKLAELVQTTESEIMPLEKKMNTFSRNISIVILVLVGIIFGVGVGIGFEWMEMFLVSVSLAVGAIPEGLPAIIAITLAFAVKKMYKVNVLIRRLPAAETLGRATVICTDKTGTLTEESLRVDEIWSSSDKDRRRVLEIGLLCNNARDEGGEVLGDPTEVALVHAGKEIGMDKRKMTGANKRVKEFGFDSERKMMSLVRVSGNIKTSYVKGAPLDVLSRCTKEFVKGKIVLIGEKRRKELVKVSRDMERRGLRVLGFGFRQITKVDQKNAENNLIFSGFVGMIDPPRKEVRSAIREALQSGIIVKIITGDSALTTAAIAEKIGLKGESSVDSKTWSEDVMIEGGELEGLSEEKWDEVVRTKMIFARVTPQQKLKIVDTLKAQGHVVAVTGDGVNDILALKRADIGVSMGKRGNDAARDSSDMILLDDNFSSIIAAVKQGRRIYDNIKKSIMFLLSVNAANIFIIMYSILIGIPLPFLPLAILWMNIVTDSIPALALALEKEEKNIMKRGPDNPDIFENAWLTILISGLLNFFIVVILYYWSLPRYTLESSRTMAITVSIFYAMFFIFSCKSKERLSVKNLFDNKWLIYSVIFAVGIHLISVYTSLGKVFEFVPLSLNQILICLFAGFLGLVFFEIGKIGKGFVKSRR